MGAGAIGLPRVSTSGFDTRRHRRIPGPGRTSSMPWGGSWRRRRMRYPFPGRGRDDRGAEPEIVFRLDSGAIVLCAIIV